MLKRFAVTTPDNVTLKLYYENQKTAESRNPDAVRIEEIVDNTHIPYCKRIVQQGKKIYQQPSSSHLLRQVYEIDTLLGKAYIKLYMVPDEVAYYDVCSYQIHDPTSLVKPITWTISTPKEFCDKYLQSQFQYEILSGRVYGQPKLAKPKELKGIKADGSVLWLGKAKCQWFIQGNDIYVKHRDYFSQPLFKPEDVGTPLEYRLKKYGIKPNAKNKFIYADCWGAVVLRNEAWIRLKNIIPVILNAKLSSRIADMIIEQQMKLHNFDKIDSEWNRFWEVLCHDVYKKVGVVG